VLETKNPKTGKLTKLSELNVIKMQDIGTGTRTAMAQIAAEELGIPFEHVQVSLGDSARGPFASISAGSSTIPSMGPAVRLREAFSTDRT